MTTPIYVVFERIPGSENEKVIDVSLSKDSAQFTVTCQKNKLASTANEVRRKHFEREGRVWGMRLRQTSSPPVSTSRK